MSSLLSATTVSCEPRQKDARFISLGEDVAGIINSAPAGSKFVLASGTHNVPVSIRPKANVEVWGEAQADLLPIPNKWGYQPGEYVDTPAHIVKPSAQLVFATGVEGCIDGQGLGGQKLVDLALKGGTATGGPGAWGPSGRTVSQLFDGEVRRCLITNGEINGIGNMRGLVQDTEIHSCGNRSGGFAAGAIKTVHSLEVVRCFVHDTLPTTLDPSTGGNGIWADRNTPILKVTHSLVADCAGSGVFYEVSRDGFLVADCLIWNNNQVGGGGYAGVKMVSSMSGEVARCSIRGNRLQQVFAWNDGRWDDHKNNPQKPWGWPINPLGVHDCDLGDAGIVKQTAAGAPQPVIQASTNT